MRRWVDNVEWCDFCVSWLRHGHRHRCAKRRADRRAMAMRWAVAGAVFGAPLLGAVACLGVAP